MKKNWWVFIQSVTKTQTIKDALIVTLGMGLSTVLSALAIFFIARFLGPGDFGLYTGALAIVVIVIDALDLSLGTSIVNFASKNSDQTHALVKYGFLLKIVLGLSAGGLFFLLSPLLSKLINPQLLDPLRFASLFIPLIFLYRFPRSILQAQKQFLKDTLVENATSLFRLSFAVGFYWTLNFTVITALAAYLFGALVALLLGASFISWRFLSARITGFTKSHFFSFQKWLTLGFIVAAFHGRVDSALLLKLTDAVTNGIYQAAYRFYMPAIQLASVLSLVLAPRFASFSDRSEAKQYLFKAGKLTVLLSSVILLIIPLAPLFVSLIFGSAYYQAILPTQILSFGFVFFVAGSPFVSYLIYSLKKTHWFFILSLIQLIVIVSLDLLLIPRWQATGAALATSLTLILVNSLTAFLALKS